MNKKIILLLIIAILAVSGGVLWKIFQAKNSQPGGAVKNNSIVSGSPKAPGVNPEANKGSVKDGTAKTAASANDSDLQALDADLDAVNDGDFGDEGLSDQNVGL